MTLQSKTSQVSLQWFDHCNKNDHCRFWHNDFATHWSISVQCDLFNKTNKLVFLTVAKLSLILLCVTAALFANRVMYQRQHNEKAQQTEAFEYSGTRFYTCSAKWCVELLTVQCSKFRNVEIKLTWYIFGNSVHESSGLNVTISKLVKFNSLFS